MASRRSPERLRRDHFRRRRRRQWVCAQLGLDGGPAEAARRRLAALRASRPEVRDADLCTDKRMGDSDRDTEKQVGDASSIFSQWSLPL